MDFKLAREIYGNPWFVDAASLQGLTAVLNSFRNGAAFEQKGNKDNYFGLFDLKNSTIAFENKPRLDFSKLDSGNDYIAVTHLNGPLTKNGGESHYGTKEIAQFMLNADNNENVIGHIIYAESGGGSSNAVAELSDVMKSSKKPIVTFIDGLAASAMYYIVSYSDYIIAKRGTDLVGSIGTMIELNGFPADGENKATGERHLRIYASESTMKNQVFESAINDLNFKPILEKMLNPLNKQFISDIKANRKNVTEQQLTGEAYFASEVIGTLIDEIGSFQTAVNKVVELNNKNSINQNLTEMNKQELQQKHPDVYNEIVAEAVSQERDRVSAIMTYVDVDANVVKAMIESGKNPTQKFYAEMSRKALANDLLSSAKEESADDIEINSEVKGKDKEQISFEKDLAEAKLVAGINSETK